MSNSNNENENKIKVPKISKEIINEFNKLVTNTKIKQKKKNISLGIIKFKHNNKEYIHYPIKKIKENGNKIKIGVCSHFETLENNKINRRILSSHKYQYHYNCCGVSKNSECIQLRLKSDKSIEEVLEMYKKKDMKRKKKKLVLDD